MHDYPQQQRPTKLMRNAFCAAWDEENVGSEFSDVSIRIAAAQQAGEDLENLDPTEVIEMTNFVGHLAHFVMCGDSVLLAIGKALDIAQNHRGTLHGAKLDTATLKHDGEPGEPLVHGGSHGITIFPKVLPEL